MVEFFSRNKKIIIISLIVWLILNFGAYRFFYLSKTRLFNDLTERGIVLVQNLANQIGPSLLNKDLPSLETAIRGVKEKEDIYSLKIFDAEENLIIGVNSKTKQQNPEKIDSMENVGITNGVVIDAITLASNSRIVRFTTNVNYSDIDIGRVLLSLSASGVYEPSGKNRDTFLFILVSTTLTWILLIGIANHVLRTRQSRTEKTHQDMSRVGPYILVDKIGQGGMAELYRAEHTSKDGFRRTVALKKILSHLTQDQDFISMFIREARIAAYLRHPNIVQITDYGQYEDAYFIVLEFVDGLNLSEIMDRIKAGLPIDLSVFLALKIIAGLQYAHSKKDDKSGASLDIVHRDISPQNILVSIEGEVKIADFGLAKAKSEPSFTRTGQVKGKQQYMSPEQALGKKVDNRTDIYAFGIVLYEILTGRQLFDFENDIDAAMSIPNETVTPLKKIRADIPTELNRIVMKCLEKDREARYQSAQQIFHELLDLKKKSKIIFDSTDLSEFMKTYCQ